MATPDNLSGTDEIESSDLLAVWSSRNRDSRRVSYGQFRDAIADSVENDMIIAVESANASAEIAQTAAETAAGTVAVAVDELRGEIDQTVADALAIPLETAVSAAALAQAASETATTAAQAATDAVTGAAKKVELLTPSGGAPTIGIQLPGADAQPTTLYNLAARTFPIDKWLTDAQKEAVAARTFSAAASVSTAIHKGIAELSALGGGIITFPPGGYLLDVINAGTGNESTYITIRSGVSLVGSGDATEFRVASGENAKYQWNIFLTPSKLENCIFRDFKVNGNAAGNLLAAGPARSNRALSATGGGKNVSVENVTFTGIPGNNTVAFSGVTDCGNIRVQSCRFLEMGSGIPGNVCVDHTDIYLCGDDNKVINNVFKSTNFITGAAWEFHGDRGEGCGNVVNGYTNGCWIAPMEQLIFTRTQIHHNDFIDVYTGPYLSSYNNSQFGILDIHNNVMRMKAGAYAAGIRIFGFYGPDKPGAFVRQLNYYNNDVFGVAGEAVVGFQPIQTRKVSAHDNHFEDFLHGMRLNAQGASLGDGYDYHDVLLQKNTIKNASSFPIYYLISKCKTLVITDNPCLTDTVQANGVILNGTADGGLVANNPISPNYTPYPITALNAGLATVNFDQPGNPGTKYVAHNMDSLVTGLNKVVYTAGTAAPTTGNGAPGDRSRPKKPVVGQSKGHFCTTFGNPGTWVSEGNL
ncbi:MAG: hypothetical protein EOP14_00185 [Pseudomonas sp.]|nr:MAG: hypothetical protein EOP14_00185 [Pseudomonas sp.]